MQFIITLNANPQSLISTHDTHAPTTLKPLLRKSFAPLTQGGSEQENR
jgi:hypothetical protein